MGSNSFVRCKTFRCPKKNQKSNYIEQDVFLMPVFKPSHKRNKKRNAAFSDMDPRKLKAYEQHKAKQNDLNDNRSKRYCKLLAETNFDMGDILVHPTYSDACLPDSFEGAQKAMANYIRRLKRLAKKKGKELKYIYVTELGRVHGRLHHHAILNADCGLTREEIEAAWGNGFCNTVINRDTKEALDYFTKAERIYKGKRLYTASRNLTKPTVTSSDTKVSRKQLQRLTLASTEEIKTYFEKLNPDYYVERVYRYVPPQDEDQTELDDDQAKLWRDGFSYLRVYMRRKKDRNTPKKEHSNKTIHR